MKKCDLFLSDTSAYKKYTDHNHIYNRLDLLKEQDVDCDPIGIVPTKFPIIIKPIIDLMAEGATENVIYMSNKDEYLSYLSVGYREGTRCRGHFWYYKITGNQYISNLLIKNGKIVFNDTFVIHKNDDDIISFYNHVYDFILTEYLTETISIQLANYSGPVCINFIDDTIIDCRLSWWREIHIFKKRSDFVSCIPILLEHNKPLNQINDDIIYVPFRINVEDDTESIRRDYVSRLKKYTLDYTISFSNIHNIENNSLKQICTFVTNSDKLIDVLAIRGKMGLI